MKPKQCRVCGRPVEQRHSTGRRKEAHQVCIALESRLSQIQVLAEQVKWQDRHVLRRLRGDIFNLVNCSANLNRETARYAPDDATDAPIQTRAGKRLFVQETTQKEENLF